MPSIAFTPPPLLPPTPHTQLISFCIPPVCKHCVNTHMSTYTYLVSCAAHVCSNDPVVEALPGPTHDLMQG
jgi:hypothetical protein